MDQLSLDVRGCKESLAVKDSEILRGFDKPPKSYQGPLTERQTSSVCRLVSLLGPEFLCSHGLGPSMQSVAAGSQSQVTVVCPGTHEPTILVV